MKRHIILEKKCCIRFCFLFAFFVFFFRRKVPKFSSFFSCVSFLGSPRSFSLFLSFLVGLREGPWGLVDRGVRSKYFKLKIGQPGQKASCILNLVYVVDVAKAPGTLSIGKHWLELYSSLTHHLLPSSPASYLILGFQEETSNLQSAFGSNTVICITTRKIYL